MTTEREEDEEATSGASSHIVCADGNNVEETFSSRAWRSVFEWCGMIFECARRSCGCKVAATLRRSGESPETARREAINSMLLSNY